MAGLMERTMTLIKAKWSKLLDRAEKPTETLDYSYERQLELLQNVNRGVADVVTAKKRLQLQTQTLEQNVLKLDTQARQAVSQGREDLARQALERKSAVQQQLQGLDGQIKQLEAQQQRLVASEQQLSARVEAFRSEKEVIKAQYSAAEAQLRIGEAAPGNGEQMSEPGVAILLPLRHEGPEGAALVAVDPVDGVAVPELGLELERGREQLLPEA